MNANLWAHVLYDEVCVTVNYQPNECNYYAAIGAYADAAARKYMLGKEVSKCTLIKLILFYKIYLEHSSMY